MNDTFAVSVSVNITCANCISDVADSNIVILEEPITGEQAHIVDPTLVTGESGMVKISTTTGTYKKIK